MMRCVWVGCALVFCSMLVGCGGESHEGLINDTITQMDAAGTQVGHIKNRVNDAVKDFESGKSPKLDLTEATKATEGLKKAGEEFQNLKRKVEQKRGSINDEDRKAYAANQKDKLNNAFKTLVDRREQLRKALEQAEEVKLGAGKGAVHDLRKKIVEAEGPFEALARQ